MDWFQMLMTIIASVFASSGFWAWLQYRSNKKDDKTQMLIGLAHDRIIFLGLKYIERGYITHDEYENLRTYLFEPYKKLGGNGSAEKVMKEVEKLELQQAIYDVREFKGEIHGNE